MRDLDRLRERDSDERGRRIGTFLMFAVVTTALVSAVAVVIGQTLQPRNHEPDALDQLDRVSAAAADKPRDAQTATSAPVQPERVNQAQLSYERELTEVEERPEVLAALEAAAREAEELAAEAEVKAVARTVAPVPSADELEDDQAPARPAKRASRDDGYEALPEKRAPGGMPAGMSASLAGQKLAKTAQHDKLVAAAMPGREKLALAPAGSDGEFTLQVISFESGAQAQAFATNLRGKGHEAFIVTAEVPGRGRTYRVRIGPFANKAAADAYRRNFDEQEHMNTIVVKR